MSDADGPLTLLTYMARYAGRDIDRDLAEIEQVSRRENPRYGITGILVYDRGYFVQILEGPEASVKGLFRVIAGDGRCEGAALLHTRTIDRRMIADWSMLTLLRPDDPAVSDFDAGSFQRAFECVHRGDTNRFLQRLREVIHEYRIVGQGPGEAWLRELSGFSG